ncbi:MAG: D-alanyl-D-alanine dipeptidase [Rhizobium sp.]|nr:D-alanyl-D-alanine dipeptidase [Rhizobium sp.]
MGTGFDFFDPLAHTGNTGVSKAARANRKLLVEAMQRRGFKNYAREWWHFSLEGQPFAGRRFDFDILPKGK